MERKKSLQILTAFTLMLSASASLADDSRVDYKRADLTAPEKRLYVRGEIGYSKPTSKMKTDDFNFDAASVYGVALGYNVNHKFSVDASLNHRGVYKSSVRNLNELQKTKFKSTSLMLSGYYTFTQLNTLKPFVMFGLGVAVNDPSNLYAISNLPTGVRIGKLKTDFGWQAGLGVRMSLQKDYFVDFSYRYVNLGKIRYNNYHLTPSASVFNRTTLSKAPRITANEFLIGLGFEF